MNIVTGSAWAEYIVKKLTKIRKGMKTPQQVSKCLQKSIAHQTLRSCDISPLD